MAAHSFPKCPSYRFAPLLTKAQRSGLSPPKILLSRPKSNFSKRVFVQSHEDRNFSTDSMLRATANPATSREEKTLMNIGNDGLPIISSEEYREISGLNASREESTISVIVVGASGDLAKKKIFPALFALFYEECLPKHFTIFGYARSKMTDAELRDMISRKLTCRIDKRDSCREKMDQFLKRCFYCSGHYDSEEDFAQLDKKLKEQEMEPPLRSARHTMDMSSKV